MVKNIYKEKDMSRPVENHDTAAWANISELKPVSNVTIPDEFHVMDAKEYVDENQK